MDITMCNGQAPEHEMEGARMRICIYRRDCLRYTATATPYKQSFFLEAPIEFFNGSQKPCEYFTSNK